MSVEELAKAGAAHQSIADCAADRLAAVAKHDQVIGAGIHEAIIPMQRGQDSAVRRLDREALIPISRRETATARSVGDDFEVEGAPNRRRYVVRVSGHAEA